MKSVPLWFWCRNVSEGCARAFCTPARFFPRRAVSIATAVQYLSRPVPATPVLSCAAVNVQRHPLVAFVVFRCGRLPEISSSTVHHASDFQFVVREPLRARYLSFFLSQGNDIVLNIFNTSVYPIITPTTAHI
jgi:hypothetical protein